VTKTSFEAAPATKSVNALAQVAEEHDDEGVEPVVFEAGPSGSIDAYMPTEDAATCGAVIAILNDADPEIGAMLAFNLITYVKRPDPLFETYLTEDNPLKDVAFASTLVAPVGS
jgi:hypothetical protein